MFKKLKNEAILTFSLKADGPLLINSGDASKMNPALPDMRFVRCQHDGKETAYLPGSSLKGVFRARYEQLLVMLEVEPLAAFKTKEENRKEQKNESKERLTGEQIYSEEGLANRLFGSLQIGSRINFFDAYPVGEVAFGMRHGVGIDRITGAAKPGALFEYEVIEQGTFEAEIKLCNFSLYQLRLILWILEDIDDGLVTLGMGGSRGNGHMRIANKESVRLRYRLFGADESTTKIQGYRNDDLGKEMQDVKRTLLAQECKVLDLDNILALISISNQECLRKAINSENKSLPLRGARS
jgi:CRISPR-associated RAMP protein (TIGR02581 family)